MSCPDVTCVGLSLVTQLASPVFGAVRGTGLVAVSHLCCDLFFFFLLAYLVDKGHRLDFSMSTNMPDQSIYCITNC